MNRDKSPKAYLSLLLFLNRSREQICEKATDWNASKVAQISSDKEII